MMDLGMRNGTSALILSQICCTLEEKEVATFLLPHLDGVLDAKGVWLVSFWLWLLVSLKQATFYLEEC